MFDIYLQCGGRLFRVGLHCGGDAFGGRNGDRERFDGVGLDGIVGPQSLDLCLDMVGINIAGHYDTLVLRMVPFRIVVAQLFRLEAVNYAHQADRHSLSVD